MSELDALAELLKPAADAMQRYTDFICKVRSHQKFMYQTGTVRLDTQWHITDEQGFAVGKEHACVLTDLDTGVSQTVSERYN